MDESEKKEQEKIHTVLQEIVQESEDFEEGQILTGWIIVYEVMGMDNERFAGHIFGPSSMTTWSAMGLIEWAKTVSLPKSLNEEDEESE